MHVDVTDILTLHQKKKNAINYSIKWARQVSFRLMFVRMYFHKIYLKIQHAQV